MKIAIDISQLVYEGTGVANYTNQLVRNIVAQDHDNEYLLFGMSLRKNKYLLDYFKSIESVNTNVVCKFISLPQSVGNFLWNKLHIFNLDSIIGKVDIFYSSDWIQPPINAKKITTVHDLVIYKYPETSHPDIVNTQKRRLYWVKKECDLVISDSEASKKDMVDILRFDPNKVEVIYPGIDKIFIPSNNDDITRVKQKYGLFDEYILFVGTMEPRKNLQKTIQAFEKLLNNPLISSRKKPLQMVITGNTGWGDMPKMSRFIHNLGLIPRNDLPAIYSGASMFVYPSLYEGFGLPVVEAMSCGCPVITSDRGSLKEITSDSAIFVDPQDEDDIAIKMTKIIIDNNLRQSLIKKGLLNAARFNWQDTVKKIIAQFDKLQKI